MLVCAAFNACSDDVIDNGQQEIADAKSAPAYLTISFSGNASSSARSTADDANNKGDEDGNAEDSGHSNIGTAAENAIHTALIIAAPESGNVGYAKLYAKQAEGENVDGLSLVDKKTDLWKTDAAIKLATGKYKVMVVINPSESILTLKPDIASTPIEDGTAAKQLYNDILEGKYATPTEEVATATYKTEAEKFGNGTAGFMMINKTEAEAELKETDTPEEPASVTVEVERVLSKITFRPIPAQGNGTPANVYPVKVASTHYQAKTVEGSIDGKTKTTLNVAWDVAKTTIYAFYKKDTAGKVVFQGAYAQSGETVTINGEQVDKYTKLTATTEATQEKPEHYYIVEDTDMPELSIQLQYDETGTDGSTEIVWYIRLEKYALVNLSKELYYVRHMVNSNNYAAPFGTLNGSNFLYTPYWQSKNQVEFDADGNFKNTSFTTNQWFYQTLKQVSDDSKLSTTQLYIDLPTTDGTYNKGEDEVGGNNHYNGVDNPAIGDCMTYCFENSTNVEHQTHGLSTGISFQAKIYKNKECTESIGTLYRYNAHTFASIQAIQDAYGTLAPDAIKALAAKEKEGTEITAEELEAAKIVKYASNVCYYYTTEIKHFDNGNPAELGNMEFAIMRNNIYSLSVSSVNSIGDPFVDPVPGTENESKEAGLNVEVHVNPWIVRYHDIEF